MARILAVCTANICRSPVMAAVLEDRLRKRGFANWAVSSAGTWAHFKRGAARNSIRVMQEYGLDISSHVAQLINDKQLSESDLILCMESGHVEALRIEFPQYADKIYLLSEMSGYTYSIPDPYGQPLDEFRHMAAELTKLIDAGLDRIIELAQDNNRREELATNRQ